jgi:hypothetical protein
MRMVTLATERLFTNCWMKISTEETKVQDFRRCRSSGVQSEDE